MGIGDTVRRRREAKGWTKQRLADEAGLYPQTICQIELGQTPKPGIQVCKCLAMALGCTIDELAADLVPMTYRQRQMFERAA
jgi:transcriptional regulator with XRE-family HTH domain